MNTLLSEDEFKEMIKNGKITNEEYLGKYRNDLTLHIYKVYIEKENKIMSKETILVEWI